MGHYAIRLNDFIECLDKYDSKKIITKMFNLYLLKILFSLLGFSIPS